MATSAEAARLPHLENERRTGHRRPLPAHSRIELLTGRTAAARDISEGGVSLFGTTDLNLGSETQLRFTLPDSGMQIEASGVITWSDELATGIRFAEISTDSLTAIQGWLESSSHGHEDGSAKLRTDALLAAKVASLREIADLQAQVSSDNLDTDAALALIVRRLAELTRATGAAIALRDGEHVICRASYGNAPDVGVQLSQSSLSGECLRTGNVVLLRDSETDPRVDAAICRQLNFRSLLIVPVLCDGKPAGIAEVLSPNPEDFEGADILVVSFIADLIAGVALPAEPSEVEPVEHRTNFEPLLEPGLPTPQIAMEVPLPAAPVATPVPVVRTAQPAVAPTRPSAGGAPRPTPARLAPASLTAAAPQPARAPLPVHAPEVYSETHPIDTATDQQRYKYLAIALTTILLIAIATFAMLRSRKAAPRPQSAPIPAVTTTPAAAAVTQAASTAVVESPKTEPKKPSPAPTHSAKTSSNSQSEPATQEVAVRESSTTSSAAEAPPVAPSLGQLSATSSANLAAAIVATNTPTPGLTLPQSRGVVEGKLIRKVLPQYPEMARRAGVGGDVILSATIGTDGKLKNIRVVSGSPLLREAAISAAKQWRYSPYLLADKPVETDTHITISFKH